ncbi:MAG: riboflavin synthase [Bdellovibrionales bacterium]|nr:riboflavin synthase [Bdellovibrionales bacterium]
MFSGIVEATGRCLECERVGGNLRVHIARPPSFDDLKPGDSVAVNGVCLTVEQHNETQIQFTLGAETLLVTGWTEADLLHAELNMERSLRLGDRIHGHVVAGHVEGMGTILETRDLAGSWILRVAVSESCLPYLWRKGSITIQGVSLTVNSLNQNVVEVCLIPETLARTNLARLKAGDRVTLEPDWMARALLRQKEVEV